MERIEAPTEQIASAGRRQAELAGSIGELRGTLASASSAACSAGDPEVSAALSGYLGSWGDSFAMLAESVGNLAGNLSAGAGAYTEADESGMR